MSYRYDLVIRGGTIADGRGGALFGGDVAIQDGCIAAVGAVTGSGREEIDARGLLVAPGFVDIHTHYDGQSTWEDRLVPSGWHGITTTVMGNCGVGFAPVRLSDRDCLVELMEGVEDLPAPVLNEGLDWSWTSFPDYLEVLEQRSHDVDICAQLPHAALRIFVMGERAMKLEPATPEDIAQMRALASEAMHAGAMGFTTSRTFNHRTLKGDPTPTLRATYDELIGIAKGLQDAGRGVLQIISDFSPQERATEFDLMRQMVRQSGRPLSVTVLQRHHDPEGWREIMDMLDETVQAGLPMCAQIAPRPTGTLYSLNMSKHPFSLRPSFRAIENESLEKKVAIMRDPSFRAKLMAEHAVHKVPRAIQRLEAFDHMFPFGDPPDYTPPRERSVTAMAQQQGRSPFEVAYDLLLEDDGHSFLFAPGTNYTYYNLDACREMIEHPHTVVGLGDGGAHVGHISDVSFSTYLLTYWARDARDRLDVGWLIKRMTSDTARTVGLLDRGVIAPGFKADINVMDFDKLKIERPYMVYDLPMGGKRLMQRARGYVATIVSGQPVYRDGEHTGALPGKLVRGPQSARGH